MLESCDHENIVAYYGSFIKKKTMWIAMEYCGGLSGFLGSMVCAKSSF